MFSFFKKKQVPTPPVPQPLAVPAMAVSVAPPEPAPAPVPPPAARSSWLSKLKAGLRKTGSSIASVFTGTQIDDALYEELEAALLMADTGVKATQYLLDELKRRVKESKTTEPALVKALLAEALAELLAPLEKTLQIGAHGDVAMPTVILIRSG